MCFALRQKAPGSSYTRKKEGQEVTAVDDLMRMEPKRRENSGEMFLQVAWRLRHKASNRTKSNMKNWKVRLNSSRDAGLLEPSQIHSVPDFSEAPLEVA